MASDDDRLSPEQRAAAIQLRLESGQGLPVQGTSMWPTFREGQLLWIEFGPDRLRRGDVIVFAQDDDHVVHRLVGRSRNGLRTRGDGKITLDRPVAEAAVLGRVVAVGDEAGWRGLCSASARVYATCLGWHHLFWAALGSLALRVDRLSRRDGERTPLRDSLGRLDMALLGVAHFAVFRLLHRRVDPPGSRASYTESSP